MKIKENDTCATCREDDRLNELEPRGSWHIIKTGKTTNGVLLCSLVQIAPVVIVHVIVVGVLGVMIVVLIGHDEVLVNLRSHFCSDFR